MLESNLAGATTSKKVGKVLAETTVAKVVAVEVAPEPALNATKKVIWLAIALTKMLDRLVELSNASSVTKKDICHENVRTSLLVAVVVVTEVP